MTAQNDPVPTAPDANLIIETDLYLDHDGDLIFICPQCAVERQAGRPCQGEVFAPEGEDGIGIHLFIDDPEDGIATAFVNDGVIELECNGCGERTPWHPSDGGRIQMRHRPNCEHTFTRPPASVEDEVAGIARLLFRAR